MSKNCPECGKELTEVNVYSVCVQKALVKNNIVEGYTEAEAVKKGVSSFECPECGEDVTVIVEEF